MSENAKWIVSDIAVVIMLLHTTWLGISRRHAFKRADQLAERLRALTHDLVQCGDMTPAGARMLNKILDGER